MYFRLLLFILDKKSVTAGMKFIFRGFCFLPKMDLDTVFCMKKVN
jgi:hypothetical protein